MYLILIHFSLKEMERGTSAHWYIVLNNMILKNKVIVENSKLHYLIKNIEEYSSDRKKKKKKEYLLLWIFYSQ